MENTQRWLLTIVNTEGIVYPPTNAYVLDVRQPEFNPETGGAFSQMEAFHFEERRRNRMREAALHEVQVNTARREAALHEVQVNTTREIEQIVRNRQAQAQIGSPAARLEHASDPPPPPPGAGAGI